MYTPTSVELSRLLERADTARFADRAAARVAGPVAAPVADRVPIMWLLAELGPRSFGLTFFVMGMVALVPGASMLVGVLLAWPAAS